ncbi:DUF2501 domain-containing protein [Brenneria sp. 4F2]|nr:DUF2501 domain-containing protein [Brenneria bubanii]
MKSIKMLISAMSLAALVTASSVHAAHLQDSLSAMASKLNQKESSSTGLSGPTSQLNGDGQTLIAGSMSNAAGVLQYCVKQKLISATNMENIKNQVLEKLGLGSQETQQQTDYTQGVAGLLKTKDGKQLNLNNIGSTPLAEKVKTKACDLVLKQVVKFIV